ncbi:hypothetical protein D9981_18315 [Pseudoalteromonas phenolica O-BC30]|nr:hypothetical protein D9981_18315 [Pseudoalteromonas phenolica O-BC30]
MVSRVLQPTRPSATLVANASALIFIVIYSIINIEYNIHIFMVVGNLVGIKRLMLWLNEFNKWKNEE